MDPVSSAWALGVMVLLIIASGALLMWKALWEEMDTAAFMLLWLLVMYADLGLIFIVAYVAQMLP